MQQASIRRIVGWAMTGAAAVALLGGCAYRKETMVPAASPATVVVTQPERVVTYSEGRYELRGDGTASSPYYWVWIPRGVVAPNPPPLPVTPIR